MNPAPCYRLNHKTLIRESLTYQHQLGQWLLMKDGFTLKRNNLDVIRLFMFYLSFPSSKFSINLTPPTPPKRGRGKGNLGNTNRVVLKRRLQDRENSHPSLLTPSLKVRANYYIAMIATVYPGNWTKYLYGELLWEALWHQVNPITFKCQTGNAGV